MAELMVIGGPGWKPGKKKAEPEPEMGDEDLDGTTKKVAAKTLIAAIGKGDSAAVVKALDSFLSCGKTEETEEE